MRLLYPLADFFVVSPKHFASCCSLYPYLKKKIKDAASIPHANRNKNNVYSFQEKLNTFEKILTKKNFGNPTEFGVVCENLFRLHTSF
jgi:hypothetical protein